MRQTTAFGLLFCVAALGSCKDLPSIPPDTCGNGVVEPENKEDCDRVSTRGGTTFCRPAGEVGQCRFDCTKDSGHTCPSGFGCGQDGICRAAAGQFTKLGGALAALGDEVTLEDFDGDGVKDIRVSSIGSTRIYYGELNDVPSRGPSIPLSTRAAAGRLSSDGADDLVFGIGAGTAVFLGGGDRQLTPATFPSLELGPEPIHGLSVELDPARPGRETVLVTTGLGGNTIILDPTGQDRVIAKIDKPFSSIVGKPQIVHSDDAVPCDELAIAYRGEPKVQIVSLCTANGGPAKVRELTVADCPDGVGGREVLVSDLDRNGFSDILVDCGEGGFGLFWGHGAGVFGPFAPPTPPVPADTSRVVALLGAGTKARRPLAFGPITEGDIFPDFVFTDEIHLNYASGIPPTNDAGEAGAPPPLVDGGDTLAAPSNGWTEAKIVDINGDGHQDVIAAADDRIDVYTGTGGRLMNHTTYPVTGKPSLLTVGDFDGDGALDVVFREEGLPAAADKIDVMYGRRLGVPEPPVTIARIPEVIDMVAGPQSTSIVGVEADALADVTVLAKPSKDTQFVSFINGATNRQLFAPISMFEGNLALGNLTFGAPEAFAVGNFTLPASGAKPHASVIAVALSGTSGPNGPVAGADIRAWLLPITGDAELAPGSVVAGPPIEALQVTADRSLLPRLAGFMGLAIDLGGEPAGLDEAVFLVPETAAVGPRIVVQSFDGTSTKSAFREPTVALTLQKNPAAANVERPLMRAADIDADGKPDLVVMGVFDDRPGVRAYLNTGSGAIDATKFIAVEGLPPDASLFAFATLNLDDDPALEIAVATNRGVFFCNLDETRTKLVAKLAPIRPDGPVSAMVGGDVTGDGVDDLVIVTAAGAQIFEGKAVIE
jgi:hypothetical protein